MGRNTETFSIRQRAAEEFDEDASVIEVHVIPLTRHRLRRETLPPDDSVPLFLSDRDEEPPRRPSFAKSPAARTPHSQRTLREPVSPRIIKASILAASVVRQSSSRFSLWGTRWRCCKCQSLARRWQLVCLALKSGCGHTASSGTCASAPEPVVAVRTASADRRHKKLNRTWAARSVSPTAKRRADARRNRFRF